MPGVPVGAALRQVERLFGEGTLAGLSESQLLDRFVASRDEAAFEAIVRRHGNAVMSVCRRLLGDPHEAEDAFQATFLVLARRAGGLRRSEPIGPWLVGVAYRIASKARVASARRRRREAVAAGHRPESVAPVEPITLDLAPLIWEELHRLPRKYRDPVVLCWVEGHTHHEAAEHLRWPVGTVKGRLHRARETLRLRLSRRGIAAPAAGFSSWFATESTAAVVPSPLIGSTIQSATALAACGALVAGTVPAGACLLARGALRTMAISKLSTSAATLLVAGGAVATSWGAFVTLDGNPTSPADAPRSEEPLGRGVPDAAFASSPSVDDPFAGSTKDGEEPELENPFASQGEPALEPNPPRRRLDLVPTQGDKEPSDNPFAEREREGPVADLDALKAQRVALARSRLETQARFFEAGTMNIDRFLDAARALLDAQLDAASTPSQRRTALEEYHDLLERSANREQVKLTTGTGSEADVAEARLALAEAKIKLAGLGTDPTPNPGPMLPGMISGRGSDGAFGMEEASTEEGDPAAMPGTTDVGMGMGMGMPDMMAGMASTPDSSPMGDGMDMAMGGVAAAGTGRGDDPASMAIKAVLESPIAMPFAHDTPLNDVVEYIRQATAHEDLVKGIPIYVDEVGLQEAEQSPQSPVRIDLEGIPLRTTLWLALRQLDLAYTVIDGVLVISSREALQEMITQEPIFRGDFESIWSGMGGMGAEFGRGSR